MKNLWWLSIVLAACVPPVFPDQIPQGQQFGSISGRIVDQQNVPVPGVLIRAYKASTVHNEIVNYFESDSKGNYVIDHLAWGSYSISTKKESSGYADTYWDFYSNNLNPMVNLNANSPRVALDIHLGPKAGRITGLITDAISGNPLPADMKMTRVAPPHPSISEGVNTHFSVLVPCCSEVFVEVTASGYETWYYSGPSDPLHRMPLNLSPDAELILNIKLTPKHNRQ